jgi:predicted O-methyltransferase YrrM/lipopolysaccharide biosynthesis glycosyltransferase
LIPVQQKVICNVASQSHLGQFLVLVDSILVHEPALEIYLLVIDVAPDDVAALQEQVRARYAGSSVTEVTLLTLDQVYGGMADTLRFCYDAFELCMIARGGLHKWLMEQTSHERWLYLDGDMYCFASLDPVFSRLLDYDIVISAHRDSPCETAEEDLWLITFGAYNGGLLGVRRGETGRKFCAWFHDRMIRYGRTDNRLPTALLPNQRLVFFGDQTWLTLVPMYFEKVCILKDRGANFGPWNLQPGEDYVADADGGVSVGADRLTILHLSGWKRENPDILSYYTPRDLSGSRFWQEFKARYLPALAAAQAGFRRDYRYLNFDDGLPISPYQRRAYLKLVMAGKNLGSSPFARRAAIEGLAADFDTYDYFPPGLAVVTPDAAFPSMVEGNRHRSTSPFHRKEVPHKWYVDIRYPSVGFVSRDEALILYNTARQFAGKAALEIGCWMGWSACHLALGGVVLDVVDPSLAHSDIGNSVTKSLHLAGVAERCKLYAGASPAAVQDLAERLGRRWSLIFIDGSHEAPHPLEDAIVAERYAEETAIVLFHDMAFPDVAPALDYLRGRGWNTMLYLTMQGMGVAWRGQANPVAHVPDPNVAWQVPHWLKNYRIST